MCNANNTLVCQLYHKSTKSLEKYCEWFNGAFPKNCAGKSPSFDASQVVQLTIGGCNTSTIIENIKQYSKIKSLDISFSGLKTLDWFDFELVQLKKLNASFNLVSEIPLQIVKNAPEIIEMDLSYNKILTIDSNFLKAASKLKKINLSYNLLQILDPGQFGYLIDLEYIDLSGNRFNDIPILSQNKRLKIVHLEENPIRNFSCAYMSGMSSVSVYLSWKNVLTFTGDYGCYEKRMYVVASSKYDGIVATANGNFKLLCNDQSFMSLNHFSAGSNSFKNVAELLKCFNDVQYIDLSSNRIGQFNPTTAFKKFYFLERLNLSNTLLHQFDANDLQSPSQLKSLDLSHNQLKGVHSISLLSYLSELNLEANQLQNTPEIVQHLPATVKKLNLSGNFVGKLNGIMFKRLIALQTLGLNNTSLSFACDNPFERLTQLSSLDVSHNNLSSVNFSMLSKTLNRLEEFRAAHCQINNTWLAIQHLSTSIRKLDLSGNHIESIVEKTFTHLTNLEELKISCANISHFETSSLKHSTKLITLDISYNKLQTIDVQSIPSVLKQLNLEGNNLVNVDNFKRSHLPDLMTLAISKNQLQCNNLQHIIDDLEGVQFIDNPFYQKNDINCHLSAKLTIPLVLMVLIILIIIVCICFIFRKLCIKPFQTIYSIN